MAIELQNMPVIIGTSISGMGVSKKLSNQKIPHILIGDIVQSKRPTLGESIEIFGTRVLTDLFPNQHKYYHAKLGINYHLENTICHFDFKRSFKLPEIMEMMKRTKYNYMAEDSYSLLHVDRAEFDPAIFREVTASPYCRFINCQVEAVNYDQTEDSVNKIYLKDGTTIIPSYVFDGTNALRVLATMLNIEVEYLTAPLRLVYTHYAANPSRKHELNSKNYPWYVFTNILRHYSKSSGFDGSSWCIPVGEHLSIGTNIYTDCSLSDTEIMEITKKLYQKRGVDYKQIYTENTQINSLKGPYYYCKKVFGKNWILASGAAALTWYTAQTGVESAMFVANIADRLLRFPQYYGEYFQNFVHRQIKMHKIHDWLHYHEKGSVNYRNAHEYIINSIRNIQSRYLLGMLTTDHQLIDKLEWLTDIEHYCSELTETEMEEIIKCVEQGETCAEYVLEAAEF